MASNSRRGSGDDDANRRRNSNQRDNPSRRPLPPNRDPGQHPAFQQRSENQHRYGDAESETDVQNRFDRPDSKIDGAENGNELRAPGYIPPQYKDSSGAHPERYHNELAPIERGETLHPEHLSGTYRDNRLLSPAQRPSQHVIPDTRSGLPGQSGQPVAPTHSYSSSSSHSAPRDDASRSVWKTVFKFLGWTILISIVLLGIVLGTIWWTGQSMLAGLTNLDTQATIVTKAPVVASLKQVNKQVFIEHNNMVDVDYTEAPEGWLSILPIEQSFVVLLRGRVPAGFDLSQLTEDDVWISPDGTKAQLVLPPPVIFEENVAVNFEDSRILLQGDTCPDFLCEENLDAIQKQIIPQGRQLLIETSRKSGIMEQTAEMGIHYYEALLRSLGFAEVQVFVKSELEIQQGTD